ncbi:medium-chain fatty acid-CoA ligase faa2 [Coemansia sp. RSA 1646]|nr:medium-chain fatty acid-CoA ligase faa2 [Coemansia sp. RSA 1646]
MAEPQTQAQPQVHPTPHPHLHSHVHGHHHHHHHYRNYHPNRGHHHHNSNAHYHHNHNHHHHNHPAHHHQHHSQNLKAYIVPNSARPGYSSILRHPYYRHGKFSDEFDNVLTLYDLFQRSLGMFPSTPFLGTRHFSNGKHSFGEYRWKTVRDVAETIDYFGSGLDVIYEKHASGGGPSGYAQLPLGIYSKNRAEWIIAEFSAFRSRRYTVALYDTADSDTIEHIIGHAQINVLVCSIDKVPALLTHKSAMPNLRVIISMDTLDGKGKTPWASAFSIGTTRALHKHAEAQGVVLLDMASVVALGRNNVTAPRPPSPNDVCTISYTSGTTGRPKGVVSTHSNYVYSAKSMYHAVPLYHSTYLSFFTLAHCFERNIVYTGMLGGMHIGFFSGDVERIFEDTQALKPTVMAGVPHLFNEIYHRVSAETTNTSGWSGTLARTAIRQKMQRLDSGKGGVKHGFWDRFVCNRIAQLFGGRLKLVISGGDPIDAHVLNFLRVAISCPLLETYGLSESCAVGTACLISDRSSGHVGVPLPGIDVCLRDVPEIGFLTSNQPCARGELLLRGPNVFMGYYRDDARTHVATDGEWLATGDLAQLNDDGNIEIIDRKENIVRIAEPFNTFVALEHLETVYTRHPLVHDIFIYSIPDRSELVAVVVPVPGSFFPLARNITGNRTASVDTLANDDQVRSAILIVLYQHGKKAHLRSCEMIADVFCETVPFDIEGNGLLTSTYKLRRKIAAKYYKSQIDEMYARIAKQP